MFRRAMAAWSYPFNRAITDSSWFQQNAFSSCIAGSFSRNRLKSLSNTAALRWVNGRGLRGPLRSCAWITRFNSGFNRSKPAWRLLQNGTLNRWRISGFCMRIIVDELAQYRLQRAQPGFEVSPLVDAIGVQRLAHLLRARGMHDTPCFME